MYHLYEIDEEPQPLDWQLLTRILDSFEQPQPWTLGQLETHYGDSEAVLASLRRLNRYGLVDRLGFYVIASRSAIFYRHLLQRFAPDTAAGGTST